MSDSETYDEDLIAAGNFEEKTMDDIKVHISGDPDLSRSQGIASIDISSIINSNNSSPNQAFNNCNYAYHNFNFF